MTVQKLPEGEWALVAYRKGDSWEKPVAESDPSLSVSDGRVSGTSGLNRFMGADASLPLGPLATTMMAGPEELMEQESQILAHLDAVDGWTGESEGISLTVGELTVVKLVPIGTERPPAPV